MIKKLSNNVYKAAHSYRLAVPSLRGWGDGQGPLTEAYALLFWATLNLLCYWKQDSLLITRTNGVSVRKI